MIGRGSSAVVRRGHDLIDDEPVAVKLFHLGSSVQDRRRQRRELGLLADLHHPGLVGLRDGGSVDDRPFVVVDLVDGPTLAERLTEGPLPFGEVRTLGAGLADALAHVHAAGIVHRDIKPANVLLDGTRARLADFGIARAVDGTVATETGCVVGTAAYLAPEQACGQPVGPPADVYALGLLLLETITGRREYPGLPVESATARLFRAPDVPDQLPDDLSDLLRAMTADDPAERPSAAVVAARLAPSAPRPGARHRLRRLGRRGRPSRRTVLGAAAVVVAITGGAAAVALSSDAPPTPAAGRATSEMSPAVGLRPGG